MRIISRCRHELARRPWIYWLVVVTLVVTVAASARSLGAAADARRDAWGRTVSVRVATRVIDVGEPLAAATEVRRVPAAIAPASAVSGDLDTSDQARQRVGEGEIVTATDLAPGPGVRGLIPDGSLAVAVTEAVPSGARMGDPVVVVADGVVLAADARVVRLADATTVVAVPADEAPAVAAAATAGSSGVALLLRP